MTPPTIRALTIAFDVTLALVLYGIAAVVVGRALRARSHDYPTPRRRSRSNYARTVGGYNNLRRSR